MSLFCTCVPTSVTVRTVYDCVFGILKVHGVRSWCGYVFAVRGQMKVAVWK